MSYSGSEIMLGLAAVVVVLLIVGSIIFGCMCVFHSEASPEFTVTGKENVKSGKDGKYLIFTDKATYEITDTIVHWRWNSSDVYGTITVGKKYTATLQSYRIPFFSMYQNVISPVEVLAEKK